MWKFFDRILRRLTTPAARPSTKRKSAPGSRSLLLEALEARWVPSTYSISANFNSTAVAVGNSLWFSSVVNSVTGLGSSPATIHVTNQIITFTDSFAGSVSLSLPNADLTLTPGLSLATTTFDTTNVKWVTNDPTGLAGNDFLSAGALALPSGLHGGDTVTWTASFTSTVSGLSLNWAWAAAAYTGSSSNYNSVYSTLEVKPCDSSIASSYLNLDKAGTPEYYKSSLTSGGTGSGSGNYTGNFSSNKSVTPTYTATTVSIAGIVYSDVNGTGTYGTGDTGISGVTLTLSGTTTGNASVTATTTTAADGTYSFTIDSNGNSLVAGTYQISETEPVGYYKGSDTVGSVSGSTDGAENTVDVMSSITLAAGQNGTGYNFGEVDPFSAGSVPYPYSSTNSLTNVAFNESQIMYGASVNLATSTFDIFYSDEHALCLGVNQVTVQVSATTTSGSKTVTVATSGLTVGATVSGTGIPAGTTIASIGQTTITLNNAATANGTATLTFTGSYSTAQMPSGSSTASAVNPGVGDTNVTGAAGAVDASGRPLFPSLYVTDITNNPSSLSGDWQSGGTAVTPSAIYGSWKSYALTVNETVSPASVTQTGGTDPTPANGWTLPSGADPVPSSISGSNAGYGTEIQWSLASLYSSGVLIPGHNYRFYFVVHDGDQNNVGGDVGQIAYDFTYRGPVTIAGNVYNDVYGNGVDGAGDNGIGGVTLTLSGTTSSGQSVTATTTTASNGSYTFTTDSNGNLLQGGTYKVTETPPSGYLPGFDTVGLTSWNSGFSTVLSNTSTNGPGYVHEAGGSSSESVFTGANSLDTNSLTNWQTTTGTVAASNDIVDAFDSTFNDSLTGHTFLLSGLDRYSASAGTSVGYWAFQNSVSVNANGTFSGVHTNGDLLFIVNVSVYGATSVAEYEWSGSDSTGSLVQITPAVGAVDVFVNTSSVSVPWSFSDSSGNISPQAGEFLEIGVDLNAVYGLTVPTFRSFLAETRSGNATGSSLLDFALGTMGTVSGSFTADGSLAPPYAIGSIVTVDGQNGINYNFGHVQPVTVAGLVYQDTNGNGVLDSGEPGIGGVTLTLSGTNNLGNPVTATTTTAANGTYSFTTYNSGQFIPPGTYTITEAPPAGYLAGGTNVGTVNGTVVGTVVTSGTIGSIRETTGQNGINYDFGEVKPVTVSGEVYQDTNGNGKFDTGEPGIGGVTLTLSGTNNLGQSITATTTTASNGTYTFTTDSNGNQLRPGTYQVVETPPSGYLLGSAAVGTVNGTADGSVSSATAITTIALTSGQNGINYLFGDVLPVTVSGLVYQDMNGTGVYSSSDLGIAGVTVTLSGTNGLGQSITATTTTVSGGTYSFSTDSNGNQLRPGTYQIVETQPTGYFLGAAAVGTVNGTADGTVSSATKIISVALTSGQNGINYLFGDVKGVSISGTVYQDVPGNGTYSTSDPGVAGVTLTLTGTNNLGQSITATTVSGANGTYTFNSDSNGNPLRPGTYQVTETIPSGYLPGSNFVGTLIGTPDNYAQGFTQALTASGPGYTHNVALNSFKNGSSDTAGISTWGYAQSSVPQKDLLLDGFASTYIDPSGDELLLASADRYANNGDSTIGFWFLQNPLSINANGTFNGSHTTGDILVVDDFSGSVGTLAAYEWVGTDGSGTLQPLTLPAGSTYFFVNTSPFSVPWSFSDSSGNTSPQAGEYMAIGLDLNAILGSSVPHFTSTQIESRASNSTSAELKSFIIGGINSVIGSNQPDGTLVGTNAIGSIVATSGVTGINYDFGLVGPDTVAGTVYEDKNDSGALVSGDPVIAGVTLTLTGTNNLGQSITATTTTAANGTYSLTTDSSGNALRPGTYTITETAPSGYLLGAATVGTVNGTADGAIVSATKISSVALTSGQSGISYNFGNLKPVSMAGTVYEDKNDNGVFDSGEPGISGVTLTLSGTNDKGTSISATTTTGSGGTYSFTTDSNGNLLRPGTYTITETLPSGYLTRAATVGTVNGTADGSAVSATKIGSVVLAESQSGISYNFGNLKPVTLAGTVYEDTNDSGALVSGDPGISGVTLTLSGTNDQSKSITATTTTTSSGTYSFTTDSSGNALRPGTYTITETLPSGYLTRAATVGTVNGSSDGTVVSVTKIGSVVLAESQSGVSYNFGNVKPVTVGGTVYEDTNDSGALVSGDPGISGVTLTLSGTNDQGTSITATATTNSSGVYSFTTDSSGNLLRPGTYAITETQPSGYLLGAASVGTVSGTSDGSVVSATKIGSIVLAESQAGISYNFGDIKSVTLAGTVYEDKNDSGALVSGDPLIAGVTLTLSGTNDQGTSITATATTNSSGVYSFTTDSNGNALRPGTYAITETQPSSYLLGAASVGTVNGTADGSVVSATKVGSIVMGERQSGISYNFGNLKPVSLAGTVYEDVNDTGALVSGDPGISGVTVTLSGTNDQGTSITATATTSSSGTYSFTTDSNGNSLRPGTYVVTETLPSAYLTGSANVGTVNGTADGAAVSATKIGSVVFAESQSGISYNFGNLKPGIINGAVYEDTNDNGVLDSGEPGIGGVTVTLSGTNDLGQSITATATTSEGGTYTFDVDSNGNALRPGTYQVSETQPSGYLLGAASAGTVNGSVDGTVLSATKIGSIVLAESQRGFNYNFGNLKPATISGVVYEDDNGTGVYGSGDAAIGGITVTLSGTNDQGTSISATTTTASNGSYSFAADSNGNPLRPGTYQVVETPPSGYLLGAASVGTVNGSADGAEVSLTKIGSIGMGEGQSGINYNFGNVKPVTLAGIVYEDVNGTGVYGSGDNLMSGVTVTLTGTNVEGVSVTATAITNASGAYSFATDSNSNVLIPGTYQVTETPPSNYLLGKDAVGTVNGTADGSLVSFTQIGSIVMGSGQNGINYDFSNVKPVTISGLVYNDLKPSGVYLPGDPGIANITITLTGTNNLGQAVTVTTTSAVDGTYSFSTDGNGNKLPPGTYTLTEAQPNGYVPGSATVGTVNGTTVGTVQSHTVISAIGLPEGQSGVQYNFGQIIPVGVAGYVYVDVNHDTNKDPGDPSDGLADQITLTGTDYLGNSVNLTTTTDATGFYSFTGLLPGTYSVSFSDQYPYLYEYANVGTVNGTLTGQNTASNSISQILLGSGAAAINYDFAEILAGS